MAVRNRHPDTKKYKFRELKVYASTEWLADNKKKYRQVFDRYDTTYVYAELSFYNKYFDEEDWEISIELKCFSIKRGRKEICSLPFRRKVSKYDNIVYIREGWGNKTEGAFWKRGTYYWEAWIEGERVATKYFYVEDAGREWLAGDNPYLAIESLRLYEGPYDDVIEEDRRYYKTFSAEETRYIYAEIVLKNLHQERSWQCELFSKFYNDARELKGQVVRLQRIEPQDDLIKITAGWGSNVKGSWRKDRYSAEIVFMDRLYWPLFLLRCNRRLSKKEYHRCACSLTGQAPVDPESRRKIRMQTFEEVMAKLDSTDRPGRCHQRAGLRITPSISSFCNCEKRRGFEEKEEINVHSVFIGNPGTGKDDGGRNDGQPLSKRWAWYSPKAMCMKWIGLTWSGEYIGQTAPKVKEAIEKGQRWRTCLSMKPILWPGRMTIVKILAGRLLRSWSRNFPMDLETWP